MKHTPLYFGLCLALGSVLSACDASRNDQTGPGDNGPVQEGDPVVVDFPIAYIERPTPTEVQDGTMLSVVQTQNIMEPTEFWPGAKLVIKDRASLTAASRIVTDEVFPPRVIGEGEEATETPALYDVRDLSISPDGTKLVFAMRAPEIEDVDESEQPTWNIWEYDIEADSLTRVIESDIIAEQGHDRFPIYLTDDSIVFSSTRQRRSKSILLDQSRPQYAYVTERDDEVRAFTLHKIDEDRVEIEQISFGRGHDIQPTLLDDGRILFLRGDNTSRNNANSDRLSFYTIHPDGSNLSLHYGFHSPSSGPSTTGPDTAPQGALTKPQQIISTGEILVSYRPRESNLLGGDIYTVNTADYIDNTTPTAANQGATGPAENSLSFDEVSLDPESRHGRFNSAYPMNDGTDRLLVSWMPCLVLGFRFDIYVQRVDDSVEDDTGEVVEVNTSYRLIDIDGNPVDRDGDLIGAGGDPVDVPLEDIALLPCTDETFGNENIEPADPLFGVWVYDPAEQTQDPVVLATEIGTMYTEAVVFEARSQMPTFIPEAGGDDFSRELKDEDVGILNIRSIYDFDGQDVTPNGIAAQADPLQTPPDTREIRFVRFWEKALMPHEDDYLIDPELIRGRNPINRAEAKGIIGYARVFPDGSVMTKLPASVPFSFEYVDANGRRVNNSLNVGHNNWINLRPGEVKTCNGCHTADSTQPHGRQDAQPEPVYEGALASAHFANTVLTDPNGTPYSPPEVGETMAEYYVRLRSADPAIDTDPLAPSLDIVWRDEWTDPSSGATPGTDIQLEYGVPDPATGRGGPDNLQTLAPVIFGDCLTQWSSLCRAVIDYPDHIQPMFEVERSVMQNGESVDVTCTNCHSETDPEGNAQAPAPNSIVDSITDINGRVYATFLQLDFSPVVSPLDEMMVFLKGYDELFATGDNVKVVNENGVLQDNRLPLVVNGEIQYQMEPILDDNDNPTFRAVDANNVTECFALDNLGEGFTFIVDADGANEACETLAFERDENGVIQLDANGRPLQIPIFDAEIDTDDNRYLSAESANNARNQRFFAQFAEGGAHAGYLTPAELKLLSEWLDVGGQYYNELFKALDD